MTDRGEAARASYRRLREGDPTWHFCTSCPQWPQDGFVEQAAEPGAAVFCQECWARYMAGECTSP